MSAIGGVYNLDGAPVDEEFLSQMGDQLNFRGPDGGREVVCGSIGMTFRAFHTNKESRLENQPVMTPDGLLLCWDGRLDNREELISFLRSELQGVQTDVSIVMAAYVKWELDFLPRIIGDFALSLWDPHTRTLLLARDPIGPRTLYYEKSTHRIIWSTELKPLLDLTEITSKINEEYVADYLTRQPDPSQTPYEGVQAVPPGQAFISVNGRYHVKRFWWLDPNREIRYSSDREYEEHFSHLFREAVRCRMRCDKTVWAELSGGLDSSSIVCVAHDIYKTEEIQTPGVEMASLVYDEASRSDEREFIAFVEQRVAKKSHHLREDHHRFLTAPAAEYCPVIPNPLVNFAEYHKALNRLIRDTGDRVLLSGKGGDQLLNSSHDPSPELADLLAEWRPIQLYYKLNDWCQALERSYLALLRNAFLQTLPGRIRGLGNRGFRIRKLRLLYEKEFVKRMNLRERSRGPTDVFDFRSPSGRYQSVWFLRLVRELSAGYWQEFSNIDITYPYTHRPLVEFIHAIPFSQKVRPAETRSILRRALRDVLPAEIVDRKSKTLNTDAVLRAAVREGPRLRSLFSLARVCTSGYVNSAGLASMLDRAIQKRDPSALSVVYLIPLEYWLRGLENCAAREQGHWE